MKFKNFCLVVLGNVLNVKDEISKISGTEVRYVDAKGICMATFSTVVTANELKEYFTSHGRSFILFEMGEDNYGVNLTNKTIHDHLFSEIEQNGVEMASTMTAELMSEIVRTVGTQVMPEAKISGSSQTEVSKIKIDDFKDIDVAALSISEKENIVNTILDKGIENISSYDKKLLSKLTKSLKK